MKTHNKKQDNKHLLLVYTLMTLSVLSILTVLVLAIQGYRINWKSREIVHGGLVQFNSRPRGATVIVDDIKLANKTASKITLVEGDHNIRIEKDGYTSWQKNVNVKPSSVLWLNYARLFPVNPKESVIAKYNANETAISVSPNHELLVIFPDSADAKLEIIETNSNNIQPKEIVLDELSYTSSEGVSRNRFEVVGWDKNSRKIIIKHTFDDSIEYIAANINGEKFVNITNDLGVSIIDIKYSLADTNYVYILTNERDIRRVNLRDMTMTGPLASNVSHIEVGHDNQLFYSTAKDAHNKCSVGFISAAADTGKVIREYTDDCDKTLLIDGFEYYGVKYVIISKGNTSDILKGELSSSESKDDKIDFEVVYTIDTKSDVIKADFSPGNNRIVALRTIDSIVSYDMELKKISNIAFDNNTESMSWYDDYHFSIINSGDVRYLDYDGTNTVKVADNSLINAILSRNEKYTYYLTRVGEENCIMRINMSIE